MVAGPSQPWCLDAGVDLGSVVEPNTSVILAHLSSLPHGHCNALIKTQLVFTVPLNIMWQKGTQL